MSDGTRRKPNQAIFKQPLVTYDEVIGHEMAAPLGELLAAETGFEAAQGVLDHETMPHQAPAEICARDPSIIRAARNNKEYWQTVDDLLTAIDRGDDSSKSTMVPLEQESAVHSPVFFNGDATPLL